VTAWPQRRCYRVKAIVQGSIGHTGIEPKAFFNAIGQYQPKTYDLKAPRATRRANLIIECSKRDPSSLHEAIPAAAALDANTLYAAYTPLNVYAWILPVLGFIGTASGMAASIGGFRDALRGGQGQVEALAAQLGQSVIPGLSGAFQTTILALAAALVAYLCTSALRSWDQEALDELDRFCVVLLSRIPQPPSPDGEKILGVLEQISGQMRDILNVPVTIEAAAKAIIDTAEALSASSNQFESVLSSMGTAAEALATASHQSESAAAALKAAADTLKPTDTKSAPDASRKEDALETLAAVLRNFEGILGGVEGTMKGIQKTLEEPVTLIMKRGQS